MGQDNSPIPRAIMVGNELSTSPAVIADAFADHYHNKAKLLRQQVCSTPKTDPVQQLQTWLMSSRNSPIPTFSLSPAPDSKIVTGINKMKPGKKLPDDNISGSDLKLVAPVLLPAIAHVVNLSLAKGQFAACWKPQVIHPYFKKKEREMLDNYRPVSGLIQLGLLTENIVHDMTQQLHWFKPTPFVLKQQKRK